MPGVVDRIKRWKHNNPCALALAKKVGKTIVKKCKFVGVG